LNCKESKETSIGSKKGNWEENDCQAKKLRNQRQRNQQQKGHSQAKKVTKSPRIKAAAELNAKKTHKISFQAPKILLRATIFPQKELGLLLHRFTNQFLFWSLFLLVYFRRGMGVCALRTRKKGY
jgi:hypothetical protein